MQVHVLYSKVSELVLHGNHDCTLTSEPLTPCFSQVIPLLSHHNDEIVREVLAFLKAILFSGNRHVQEGMKHLLFTREEHLFSTIQELLTHAAVTHRERWVNTLRGKCKAYPVRGSSSDLIMQLTVLYAVVFLCTAMQADPSGSDGSQTVH